MAAQKLLVDQQSRDGIAARQGQSRSEAEVWFCVDQHDRSELLGVACISLALLSLSSIEDFSTSPHLRILYNY